MTRYLIILLISLLSQSGFSQKVNFSRNIGTKAVALSAIFQNGSYGAELAFEKKVAYQVNYMIALNYFQGSTEYSDFSAYSLENTGMYEFANLNDKLFLAAGLKLNMGMEQIRSKVEQESTSNFMIGVGLPLRIDFFLAKRLSIFVTGSYNLNFKSEIYNSNLRANTGLKIILL